MISNLKIINFRNHANLELEFKKPITYIIGQNGAGKTSILEAIYYLITTKSFRTNNQEDLIKNNTPFFKLEAIIDNTKLKSVVTSKTKNFYLDNIYQNKIKDYIGVFNIVLFVLEDIFIITGSPTLKRRFLDMEISQINKTYYDTLLNYKKILKQRNTQLKKDDNPNIKLLNILGKKLYKLGIKLINIRNEFINKINSYLDIYYKKTNLSIKMSYQPNINYNDYLNYITNNQEKDLKHKTTYHGPHRDTFKVYLENKDIEKFCSKGEQRLSILFIKLALLNVIENKTEKKAILLLDDVLNELDKNSSNTFINNLPHDNQIIITGVTKQLIKENIEIIKLN